MRNSRGQRVSDTRPGERTVEGTANAAISMAYATAAAGFVAYAVWGTLFPFDFHALPVETAVRLFWSQWATDAGSLSFTDLVSNVLLFLPIGLFTSAALERTWPAASREPSRSPLSIVAPARAALVTLAAAFVLSGIIELAQAFVSWRTPSILDAAAECFGAACGVAIWHYIRTECDALLRAALRMIRRATRIERILLACCAVFAVAWWLPADFTLRPAEVGDKYYHKRLLLPFTPSPDAATVPQLATIAAAAIPIGLAAVLCGCAPDSRRSVAGGTIISALALVALEMIQIPIFSRTTDGTELLAALAGATGGSVAAAFAPRPRVVGVDRHTLRTASAIVLSLGIAFVVEWWPFRFVAEAPRLFLEAMSWSRVPFRWPASASDVLPGAVLAAITGALARPRLDSRFVRLQMMVVIGIAGAVFVVCEIGRLLLVGSRPTLMSVLIKLSALVFGLCVGSLMMSGPVQRKRREELVLMDES